MLTGKSKGQPWWGEGQFQLRAAHRSNIPQRAVCPWVKTYGTHITMNLDPILNYKHTVLSPVHGHKGLVFIPFLIVYIYIYTHC